MDTSPFNRSYAKKALQDFAHFWHGRLEELVNQNQSERQLTQAFWIDFMECFGVSGRRTLLFEREAKRASTGRNGRIDVFWPGMLLIEQKSVNRDLDKAQIQADDYLAGGSVSEHEWPKYIITSDFKNFRITNARTNDQWVFTLEELPEYVDQLKFIAGVEEVAKGEEIEATIHASKIMAHLYQELVGEEADAPVGEEAAEKYGVEDPAVERASIFLTRVLFLLFGDDAGLWENDLFYRFIDERTQEDGSDLGAQINMLFEYLDTPDATRARQKNIPESLEKFPYVNGGLFKERMPIEYFNTELRAALLDACRFRWNRISTSIFGGLFQLVKSKEARRLAGEHYTAEEDILKTIKPLFLDEIQTRAQTLINNKSTSRPKFAAFLDELTTYRFFDPACGSGNFLQVAYSKLRDIETSILVEMNRRAGGETQLLGTIGTRISINQFYGIEINWWPSRIAEVALFLTEFQADQRLAAALGQAPARLPITTTAHITHADALAVDWREVVPFTQGQTYILGNPPFIGQYTKTAAQTAAMKAVWGKDYDGYLDFVTAWFKKSADFFNGGSDRSVDRLGEFAFVSTNSITQGQAVPALFDPLYRDGWRLKFAYRTFPWNSEAPGKAAVHCVITGFTRNQAVKQRLFEFSWQDLTTREVKIHTNLNAYLLDSPDVLVTKRNKPLNPMMPSPKYGFKPADGGNLLISPEEYKEFEKDPVAMKYVRRFVGARELIHEANRWCLWCEDLDVADLKKSSLLLSRIEGCRRWREEQTSGGDAYKLKDSPHLMRIGKNPIRTDYVCIPRHFSEHRAYATVKILDSSVVAGDANFVIEDSENLFFALFSSAMYLAWQRAVGGRIKSDLRFSNTLVWNTFPVPFLSSVTKEKIISAGQQVLAAREEIRLRGAGSSSLADMYNPLLMDKALLEAHKKLDRLVDKAFGASKLCSSEVQRQEILFARYGEAISEETSK